MLEPIPASTFREQPWKNGGGLTREIAAGDFWRVSIATIDRSGPFSEFPGCDRTIVAIDGDLVTLQIGDETIELAPYEPLEFPGEEPASARVTGSARDLNVITRREELAHDVEIVTGTQRFVLDEDEFAIVCAIDGPAGVDGVAVAAGDALLVTDVQGFSVQSSGHTAVVRITEL